MQQLYHINPYFRECFSVPGMNSAQLVCAV
jgi:hypothetical protein